MSVLRLPKGQRKHFSQNWIEYEQIWSSSNQIGFSINSKIFTIQTNQMNSIRWPHIVCVGAFMRKHFISRMDFENWKIGFVLDDHIMKKDLNLHRMGNKHSRILLCVYVGLHLAWCMDYYNHCLMFKWIYFKLVHYPISSHGQHQKRRQTLLI